MKDIDPELKKEARFLIEFQAQRGHTFSPDVSKELKIGLAHLYLSANSSDEFSFKKNGIPFDWRQFEHNLSVNYIESVLKRAII